MVHRKGQPGLAWLALLGWALLGCAAAEPTPTRGSPAPIATPTTASSQPGALPSDGIERVIFTQEQSAATDLLGGLAAHDGYWTPAAADALALEAALADRFAARPEVSRPLAEYRRQYLGILRGGARLVYANYFCRDLGIDWRATLVAVDDGGDCFFNLTYDPGQGQIIELMVNGEA